MKQILILPLIIFATNLFLFAQDCPKIFIEGGGEVMTGDTMFFKANIEKAAEFSNLEYVWKVSAGKISKGNGTPNIAVITDGLNQISLTATVEIKGLPENCSNTASETGNISQPFDYFPFDRWDEKEHPNNKRGRLDNYLESLREDKNSFPLIELEFIGKPTAKQINARIKFLADWFIYRKKFELLKRAVFFVVEDDSIVTRLHIGNPDIVDLIDCNDCQIIKGSDILSKNNKLKRLSAQKKRRK